MQNQAEDKPTVDTSKLPMEFCTTRCLRCLIWRRWKALHTVTLLLAVVTTSSAATLNWQSAGTNSTWSNGANWSGGVAPANSISADVASFDQTSYAFQPNAGTTSVNGLQMGDGITVTAPLNLAGTNLTIGSSGITMAANAGATTISTPVTIGAPQRWTNNSAALLTVPSGIATGSSILTISGSGSTNFSAPSGTAGVTMSGTGGLLTITNVLNTPGQLLRVTAGTVNLPAARNTAGTSRWTAAF